MKQPFLFMNKMKRLFFLFIILAVISCLFLMIYPYLNFGFIQSKLQTFELYFQQFPILSISIFCIFSTLLISFGFPIVIPFILLTGYFLSPWLAAFISSFCLMCASWIIYVIVAYFYVQLSTTKLFSRYVLFLNKLDKSPNTMFFLFRLIPMLPFFWVSVFYSSRKIPINKFLTYTLIGSYFHCFIYASLGKELSKVSKLDELLSTQIITLFAVLFVMGLVGVWFKNKKIKS